MVGIAVVRVELHPLYLLLELEDGDGLVVVGVAGGLAFELLGSELVGVVVVDVREGVLLEIAVDQSRCG